MLQTDSYTWHAHEAVIDDCLLYVHPGMYKHLKNI
jgi:hypothetical protein